MKHTFTAAEAMSTAAEAAMQKMFEKLAHSERRLMSQNIVPHEVIRMLHESIDEWDVEQDATWVQRSLLAPLFLLALLLLLFLLALLFPLFLEEYEGPHAELGEERQRLLRASLWSEVHEVRRLYRA